MALSKSSKILIDDINTALSGKIDTAGTGLSKSGTTLALATVVTAGNAGPTANATLAYSGTFTVPYITYDAYGRVTGRTNRTMTMPAASSGGTASMLSGVTTAIKNYAAKGVGYGGMVITDSSRGSNDNGTPMYYTNFKLPSGGTWMWVCDHSNNNITSGQSSGNTTIASNMTTTSWAIAIRVA